MKSLVPTLLVVLTAAFSPERSSPRPAATAAEARMAAAATAFLASLDDELRGKAVLPFGADNRRDWHYIPRKRRGVALGELAGAQRIAADRLLRTGLSQQGYLKAHGVVLLEDVIERDPGNFYVTVFGDPREAGAWGWRFEGHHVSLNFTAGRGDGGFVAHAPLFWGSNPQVVPDGPFAGLRILGPGIDHARELVRSLDERQRDAAMPLEKVAGDIYLLPGTEARMDGVEGIAATQLGEEQRVLLDRLLETHVADLHPDLAARERARLAAVAPGDLHFLWYGSTEVGEEHYYRLHAPHFVIEYHNVRDGANHVHCVWRDLENDFGGAALGRHVEASGR